MSWAGLVALVAAAVPVDRDEARQAAERELSKGIYHQNEPSPVDRAVEKVLNWIADLFGRVTGSTPGGGLGLLVLVLAIVALGAVVVWRTGPVRRGFRTPTGTVELSGDLDPDEHRRRADAHAGQGRFAEAVRERMRAIVRELEVRAVIEPRPGRTADEVAREAGGTVPAVAGELRLAARVFDEIWYGGRAASAQAYGLVRDADERVRRAPLTVTAGAAADAVPGYQVPR